MFWKVVFFLYRHFLKARASFKLRFYKYLWKEQLQFDKSFQFSHSSSIEILSGSSKVTIRKGVHFRNFCSIIVSDNGMLDIGNNVFFNNYCSINCLFKMTIGDDTIFGEGVKLYDHNHIFNKRDSLIREQGMKYGDIRIGSNCWIGSNTIILPNVEIGNNVVIGANNLIYQSIPANTVIKAKTEQIINPIALIK